MHPTLLILIRLKHYLYCQGDIFLVPTPISALPLLLAFLFLFLPSSLYHSMNHPTMTDLSELGPMSLCLQETTLGCHTVCLAHSPKTHSLWIDTKATLKLFLQTSALSRTSFFSYHSFFFKFCLQNALQIHFIIRMNPVISTKSSSLVANWRSFPILFIFFVNIEMRARSW